LLARLERGYFLTSGTLEIHPEPNRPNDEANNASANILSDF
jgi:hypothetical protein